MNGSLLTTLAVGIWLGGAGALSAQPAPADALAAFVEADWRAFLEEHPLAASDAGERIFDDRLERVRPEDFVCRGQTARRQLGLLAAIDPSALSPRDRITHG